MKVDVVLGLQWGDEGKGKIIDVLSAQYPVVARFQGGPNAGHSLQAGDLKFVTHTIPSGILQKRTMNVIGNGVVLDPVIFEQEALQLQALGFPVFDQLYISKKAHLILPTHRLLDAASEQAMGKGKIGSTLKGIGPTYMDKTGRNGLRVGDILAPDFLDRYNALKAKHEERLKQFNFTYDVTEAEATWLKAIETLRQCQLIDGEYFLNQQLKDSQKILAEGAQGSLLDVDFGSYPFVTSSSTLCAGACIGLGISPVHIGKVYGTFKAYCTRVGSGPFPTELFDEYGAEMQRVGHEYGATTGRARRTGWLDLVALKYAVMLNGVSDLIMMKADVLDGFDQIKVCVAYKVDGVETKQMPYDTYAKIEPVYRSFKGWKRPLDGVKKEEELPFEFMNYVRFIEGELGLPIRILSLGPDRSQTIVREF